MGANVITITSGKGGVGKSTVAVNLAAGLARSGSKVGLVDGDIHGPSSPLMFGVQHEHPQIIEKNGKQTIVPFEKFGVKLVSMGFFADPSKALIWRGPLPAGRGIVVYWPCCVRRPTSLPANCATQ